MTMTLTDDAAAADLDLLRLRVFLAEHGAPDTWLCACLYVAMLAPADKLIRPERGSIPRGVKLLSERWALPGGALREAARSIGAKPYRVRHVAGVAADDARLIRPAGHAYSYVAANVFDGLQQALHNLKPVLPNSDTSPLMQALRRLR